MGVENCCLRPEEKKDEITHSSQINEEKNNLIPQNIKQINELEANKQLQIQQMHQNINQEISSEKIGNTHEVSINENEQNEKPNNDYSQQGKDFPKQNEENEERSKEQMGEQVEELGEEGEEEEEGQVVEIHEEIEIEDITPGIEGVKFEEDINPLEQLGETVTQTTYINNPNNINNNNYTQEELNNIFNIEGNNISKPANSYIDYNSQNIPFVSTASAEGAFDLNNMQIQTNEINNINNQNLNYYDTASGALASNNMEDLNILLKNGNNEKADIEFNNLGQNTGNFGLNNLNVDSLNNNANNSQYNLESKTNYNNDFNSLVVQDSNSGPDANYPILANPLISAMTFGVQNEGNNHENLENSQMLKNNIEGFSYINPAQSASYNYNYSFPTNFNSTQY